MRSFFFAVRRRAVLSALAGTGLVLLPGCAPPPPLIVSLHPFPPYHLLQWASQRTDPAIRWNVVATATRVVAEGVENAACVAALAPFPTLIHQGWFYGRPVPANEFAATWLGRGATNR